MGRSLGLASSTAAILLGAILAFFGLNARAYGAPCEVDQCTHPTADAIAMIGVALLILGILGLTFMIRARVASRRRTRDIHER